MITILWFVALLNCWLFSDWTARSHFVLSISSRIKLGPVPVSNTRMIGHIFVGGSQIVTATFRLYSWNNSAIKMSLKTQMLEYGSLYGPDVPWVWTVLLHCPCCYAFQLASTRLDHCMFFLRSSDGIRFSVPSNSCLFGGDRSSPFFASCFLGGILSSPLKFSITSLTNFDIKAKLWYGFMLLTPTMWPLFLSFFWFTSDFEGVLKRSPWFFTSF